MESDKCEVENSNAIAVFYHAVLDRAGPRSAAEVPFRRFALI